MKQLDLDKYKGVIFDLDGTIFDLVGAIRKAVEDGIVKYKINVNIDDALSEVAHLLEDLQNYTIPKIILQSYDLLKIKLLEGISLIKKLRIVVYIFGQFNQYNEDSTLFEGVDKIISKLSKKVKLAILTNNQNIYAENILKKFNLDKYFDLIIGFNEVSEVKPSPEGILKILEKWKMKPSEIIFIGDMTTDIQAGKAAEVKMICVASGLAPKQSLMRYNPDILVDNTLELKKLFNF